MQVNQAHWHLMLNHFPIVLSIIGTGFLLFSLVLKKQYLKTSGSILLLLAAGFIFPAFETGEGAEESIEEISGVSQELIEQHEETASLGYKILIGTGILALISLFFGERKNKFVTTFFIITLTSGIASSAYLIYVGKTGGAIRHPETQENFTTSESFIEISEDE